MKLLVFIEKIASTLLWILAPTLLWIDKRESNNQLAISVQCSFYRKMKRDISPSHWTWGIQPLKHLTSHFNQKWTSMKNNCTMNIAIRNDYNNALDVLMIEKLCRNQWDVKLIDKRMHQADKVFLFHSHSRDALFSFESFASILIYFSSNSFTSLDERKRPYINNEQSHKRIG